MMVPRVSYFPFIMNNVTRHFSRSVGESSRDGKDLWLDSDGQALKMHYPIGLLWDLVGSTTTLPWNLTIHFSKFPEKELVRCSTQSAMEATFISVVKEADSLKHRGEVITNLVKKDHNSLLSGLTNAKFDQFWSINRKLMDFGIENAFRFIPLRIYLQSKNGSFIQKLAKPVSSTGQPVTIIEHLTTIVDSLNLSVDDLEKSQLITHGIAIPPDTPLTWMSCHLSYPDNFIHLIIDVKES